MGCWGLWEKMVDTWDTNFLYISYSKAYQKKNLDTEEKVNVVSLILRYGIIRGIEALQERDIVVFTNKRSQAKVSTVYFGLGSV